MLKLFRLPFVMKKKELFICLFSCLVYTLSYSQNKDIPFTKSAIKLNREKQYSSLKNDVITKYLSLPLTDTTQENWQEAFYAIELLNYKQPWVSKKITTAVTQIENYNPDFQGALLALLYSQEYNSYTTQIKNLFLKTDNAKVFALCAEYLMRFDTDSNLKIEISKQAFSKFISSKDEKSKAIISSLMSRIISAANNKFQFGFNKQMFTKIYLKNNVVVYSIQRKNRNYPGIVIVKDTSGNFIKNKNGDVFSVPQLARSVNNLPFYLTGGNTPQGIFRMFGFGQSKIEAIGPTENLQLTMPFETSIKHFFKNDSLTDSVWTSDIYSKLLPSGTVELSALYQTFYASKAGRTEIIAHGTTVNPEYYKGQTYYPLTPTEGCLCTKEIWSNIDGKRTESNQQKLVDAIKKAGGADGYLIVVEIDDQQKPVNINEISSYLK